MAGIRLRHDSAKGVTFVVLHPTRKYTQPYLCPRCKITHTKKAYHLTLDSEGCTIVAPGVFEALRECGLPHLTVENDVQQPPPQRVGIGSVPGEFEVLEHEVTGNKLLVMKNKLLSQRRKPYG